MQSWRVPGTIAGTEFADPLSHVTSSQATDPDPIMHKWAFLCRIPRLRDRRMARVSREQRPGRRLTKRSDRLRLAKGAINEEACASSGKKAGRMTVTVSSTERLGLRAVRQQWLANSGSADRIPSVEMIMVPL
jgi:hypothetical protein